MQLISNMLKCNISMHSFCGKIYASYFKMDGVKNIYKVREQLLSCRTDKRTSYSILGIVDV